MASAVTTAASPYSVSFLKYAIAFIAGGLFFSSAIAACTACYAIGMDNVKRGWAMMKVVLANIWITFTMGLGAVKATFLADGSWKWREAWNVLKQKLNETRQKAVEGVEAIKREANLYAAAVGAPGLIPLQYALDRLMPFSIATALEDSLRDSLADVKVKQIKKLTLASFSAGTKAPKLEAARIYDLNKEAMAFDCDVTWDSELEATVRVTMAGGLARVPITIKNVRFQGVIRVIFTPMISAYPGFGATLISLANKPTIGLDIKVAGGEVTRVPRLRAELLKAIQQTVHDTLLWPKRVVVPSVGLAEKPVLPRNILKALEETDPLLEAEEALGTRPMLRRKMDIIMDDLQQQEEDETGEDKFKAIGLLPTPNFKEKQSHDTLESVQNGVLWENLAHIKNYIDNQIEGHTWGKTSQVEDNGFMLSNTINFGGIKEYHSNGQHGPTWESHIANLRSLFQESKSPKEDKKKKESKQPHTTII